MMKPENDAAFWHARPFLLEPVPEISEAAAYLSAAVDAHLAGDGEKAEMLIRKADIPAIAQWTDALWGKQSIRVHRLRKVEGLPALLSKSERLIARMPNSAEKKKLVNRDGFHCRYCGIPLIREEIRKKLNKSYPEAARWGNTTRGQHAALQAMWLVYEHVVPHSRGGDNSFENMIISCQPCNCAKMGYTIEELGLSDPRLRPPVQSSWDGLERLRYKINGTQGPFAR